MTRTAFLLSPVRLEERRLFAGEQLFAGSLRNCLSWSEPRQRRIFFLKIFEKSPNDPVSGLRHRPEYGKFRNCGSAPEPVIPFPLRSALSAETFSHRKESIFL